MTSVPPVGQPPIPPSTFPTALSIQPNYLRETCLNDLAWLRTFFTLFLSLTFPLWTGPHLSRLLRHLPGRDSEVSAPDNQQHNSLLSTSHQISNRRSVFNHIIPENGNKMLNKQFCHYLWIIRQVLIFLPKRSYSSPTYFLMINIRMKYLWVGIKLSHPQKISGIDSENIFYHYIFV